MKLMMAVFMLVVLKSVLGVILLCVLNSSVAPHSRGVQNLESKTFISSYI